MRVSIHPGDSRRVRLPKSVLEQLGFGAEADLTLDGARIVLTPVTAPRAGWAKAFAADPAPPLNAEDRDWLKAQLDSDDA